MLRSTAGRPSENIDKRAAKMCHLKKGNKYIHKQEGGKRNATFWRKKKEFGGRCS
jgi:hypothetical protein